jgi:hypothetical protein
MRRDLTGQTRTGDEERRGFSSLQPAVSITKAQQARLICAWRNNPACQTKADVPGAVPWVGWVGWISDSLLLYSLDG